MVRSLLLAPAWCSRRARTRAAVYALAAAAGAGCGRSDQPPPDSSLASAAPGRAAAPGGAAPVIPPVVSTRRLPDTVAAQPILWDANMVATRLSEVGLAPRRVRRVRVPFFSAAGDRFELAGGAAAVETFFYGDGNAVALDVGRLDTTRVAPPGGSWAWDRPPRLTVDNNMAAVILTANDGLRRRIERALSSSAFESHAEP